MYTVRFVRFTGIASGLRFLSCFIAPVTIVVCLFRYIVYTAHEFNHMNMDEYTKQLYVHYCGSFPESYIYIGISLRAVYFGVLRIRYVTSCIYIYITTMINITLHWSGHKESPRHAHDGHGYLFVWHIMVIVSPTSSSMRRDWTSRITCMDLSYTDHISETY